MYGNYINEHNQFVEVLFDCDCESPRHDGGGLYTHFYTYTRDHISPDMERLWSSYRREMVDRAPTLWEILEEFIDTAYGYRDDDPEWMEELECCCGDGSEYLFEVISYINEHGGVALPVSMFDHGCVGYKVGHPSQFVGAYPWDAGYVGLIYAKDDDIKKNFLIEEVTDDIRKQVRECMAAEVEYYSLWADGQCYCYDLYDESGTLVDSCSGFIGDDLEASNIESYTGKLTETDMTLDEWVESVA